MEFKFSIYKDLTGLLAISRYMQTTRGKSLLIEEQSQLNKRNEVYSKFDVTELHVSVFHV